MTRIEPASTVHQTRWCAQSRRRVTRPVQQFVRRKLDGRTFKCRGPRQRSIWGWAESLFRGVA